MEPLGAYAVNAVTFLVSAALVSRIGESQLRSQESLTSGHWRDVADGVRLVLRALPLRTVLVVWSTVLVGSAAVNVAEVFFVKDILGAGDIGFGVMIGASGAGLVIGSFLAAPALGKVGLRRHYAGSIVLMAIGWGGAALSPSIWIAVPFAIGGAAGNGAAIICNQILVQRGAPDRFRGRALATIMSTNYVVIGLGMATTGVLLGWYSARWIMLSAATIFGLGAVVALLMTRWLPVTSADKDHLLEAYGEAAAGELIALNGGGGRRAGCRRAASPGSRGGGERPRAHRHAPRGDRASPRARSGAASGYLSPSVRAAAPFRDLARSKSARAV